MTKRQGTNELISTGWVKIHTPIKNSSDVGVVSARGRTAWKASRSWKPRIPGCPLKKYGRYWQNAMKRSSMRLSKRRCNVWKKVGNSKKAGLVGNMVSLLSL